MPNVNTHVDIDVDDFLDACYSHDIDHLVALLIEEGHVKEKLSNCEIHEELLKISNSEYN